MNQQLILNYKVATGYIKFNKFIFQLKINLTHLNQRFKRLINGFNFINVN